MSVIATALRELMAAGVTGEALVAAVERIEAAQAAAKAPVRTARQDRNARYYENRKARLEASEASETVLNQTIKTVSDDAANQESPQTPIETTNTSEPPKGVSVSKSAPRRKGSLCPDDFQPSEAHFAKAAKAGRGREFVVSIRDRMHRWSHTNASRAVAKKSDWSLALHDWIDRTLEESGPGSGPGPHGRPPPGRGNGFGQLAAQKRAARQMEDGDGNATEHHADRSVRTAQPRAAGSPEGDARGGYGDGPGQVLDLVARRAYG
nr:hypothetical protein NG677_04385 [Methylobacterium sp. OTU13CASTA1]